MVQIDEPGFSAGYINFKKFQKEIIQWINEYLTPDLNPENTVMHCCGSLPKKLLEDVLVKIENTGLKQYTDRNGYFYFYNIPPGEYQLICTKGIIRIATGDLICVGDGPAVRRDVYFEQHIINVKPVIIEEVFHPEELKSGFKVKIYDLRGETADRKGKCESLRREIRARYGTFC